MLRPSSHPPHAVVLVTTAALAVLSVQCTQVLGLDDFINCPQDPQCPSCSDGKKNGGETDVDCGGECGKCADGKACGADGDCESGVCTAGVCEGPAGPSCTDGEKNGGETGKDCGGGACPACPVGEGCVVGTDCESLACGTGHVCVEARCDDLVKNGEETDTDCGGGCGPCGLGKECKQDIDCAPHVCAGGSCAMACTPGAKQCSGSDAQTCDADGVWQTTEMCSFGCDAGTCKTECTPATKQCMGLDTQTCDVNGTWQTTETCMYVCDAGTCTGMCSPGATQCSGSMPQTCDAMGQWQSGTACTGLAVCTGGGCVTPPSCQASATGAGMDCGPSSNESCCSSLPVAGGTFYRSYDKVNYTDQTHPATVSSFTLDKFEVSVGRFRQFVNAWLGGWRPAAGEGKHSYLNGGNGLANSASPGSFETGWDTAWEANLATTASGWNTNLACAPSFATWTSTAGANEKRPINCVTWYEAHAFCIWDGGFLPSEAEWNYAAAAGSEQRVYPWSSPPAATAIDCSYANYYNAGYCSATYTNNVGSKSPKGNGKWGHADLSGNVAEWNLDFLGAAYMTPCTDCASLTSAASRVVRGGAYNDGTNLLAAQRYSQMPTIRGGTLGARCARNP